MTLDPAFEVTAENIGDFSPDLSIWTQAEEDASKASDYLKVGVLLGAGFLVWRRLVIDSAPELTEPTSKTVLEAVWNQTKRFAPMWLKISVPAVQRAYELGSHGVLDPEEIKFLANTYASELGDYINETSTESLLQGFNALVNRKWSPQIAYRRALEGFGLTSSGMQSYVVSMENLDTSYLPNALTDDPRINTLLTKLLGERSLSIGENEAYNVQEMGKQLSWMKAAEEGLIPKTTRRLWYTAKDEKVCPSCAPMNQAVVGLYDKFETINGEVWGPTLHPNCFPAGTKVSGPAVVSAMRTWYEGDMVQIVTASGREFSVTPEHPILTDSGWIRSGDIDNSFNLISEFDIDRMISSNPDDYLAPSLIEDVVGSVSESSFMSSGGVPVPTKELDSNRSNCEVYVVGPNSMLRDRGKISDPFSDEELTSTGNNSSLISNGSLRFLLDAMASSTAGVVSRFGKTSSFLDTSVGHSLIHGLGPVSGDDSVFSQDSGDGLSRDAFLFRQSLNALSSVVSVDQVASVTRYPFSGHVYNLQTTGEWYIANGIVVHNCRCWVELIEPEDIEKADWNPQKHPRGGNKKNAGQFSSSWGSRANLQDKSFNVADKIYQDAMEAVKEKKEARVLAPKTLQPKTLGYKTLGGKTLGGKTLEPVTLKSKSMAESKSLVSSRLFAPMVLTAPGTLADAITYYYKSKARPPLEDLIDLNAPSNKIEVEGLYAYAYHPDEYQVGDIIDDRFLSMVFVDDEHIANEMANDHEDSIKGAIYGALDSSSVLADRFHEHLTYDIENQLQDMDDDEISNIAEVVYGHPVDIYYDRSKIINDASDYLVSPFVNNVPQSQHDLSKQLFADHISLQNSLDNAVDQLMVDLLEEYDPATTEAARHLIPEIFPQGVPYDEGGGIYHALKPTIFSIEGPDEVNVVDSSPVDMGLGFTSKPYLIEGDYVVTHVSFYENQTNFPQIQHVTIKKIMSKRFDAFGIAHLSAVK